VIRAIENIECSEWFKGHNFVTCEFTNDEGVRNWQDQKREKNGRLTKGCTFNCILNIYDILLFFTGKMS